MRCLLLFLWQLLFLPIVSQTYNYYFGNLHAHTGLSDGNKDSSISGISRPDGSYAYAKLSNDFDFLGISEHNHFSSTNNPGFKKSGYQLGLNMADAANQDGTFLALFGMEYGVSSQYNGHLLIYGFNQLIGWENSTPGDPTPNYDVYNGKTDYEGIFKKVKNNPSAFCYLAHPDFSDYTTDGTYGTALSNSPYNAAYDSAIVGMPLRSGLANSNLTNYSDYSSGNYFNYYKKLLYLGYHLGIGYDHDNHYTNFGRSNGGRLVIMAPSLSRINLFTAMKRMNFYGSDDSNVKVEFTLNNQVMGSILKGNNFPTFTVVHNDPDGELADTIRIWKGYKNSGGLWAWIAKSAVENNTLTYFDNSIEVGTEYYYFAEIRQKDGQWIMTSPIWYTLNENVALEEIKGTEFSFVCFPNPVSKKLNLSFSEMGTYTLSLQDMLGRIVFQKQVDEKFKELDLADLKSGIYVLNISSREGAVSKKIVID